MRRLAVCAIFLLAVLAIASKPAPAAGDLENKALTVAEAWLEMMDAGRYGEGWDQAAPVIKSSINRRDFVKALEGVRGPLGPLVSRRLLSRNHMTSLPGVPDGDYVVIQFEASFENKRSAVETITPVLDEDGLMRIAGYYIR